MPVWLRRAAGVSFSNPVGGSLAGATCDGLWIAFPTDDNASVRYEWPAPPYCNTTHSALHRARPTHDGGSLR